MEAAYLNHLYIWPAHDATFHAMASAEIRDGTDHGSISLKKGPNMSKQPWGLAMATATAIIITDSSQRAPAAGFSVWRQAYLLFV